MQDDGFVWMDDRPKRKRAASGVERLQAEIARVHASFTAPNEPTFADVTHVFKRWLKHRLSEAAGLLKTVLPS